MIYYDTYKDFLGHHYTAKNPAASMVLIRPRPLILEVKSSYLVSYRP